MAQRKAFLLEKQQKRTEELKKRRQWHEQERENRYIHLHKMDDSTVVFKFCGAALPYLSTNNSKAPVH